MLDGYITMSNDVTHIYLTYNYFLNKKERTSGGTTYALNKCTTKYLNKIFKYLRVFLVKEKLCANFSNNLLMIKIVENKLQKYYISII